MQTFWLLVVYEKCCDYSKVNFQATMIHFSAIQFVLSADEFSNLRQEERQALLHVRKFWICLGSDYNNYCSWISVQLPPLLVILLSQMYKMIYPNHL